MKSHCAGAASTMERLHDVFQEKKLLRYMFADVQEQHAMYLINACVIHCFFFPYISRLVRRLPQATAVSLFLVGPVFYAAGARGDNAAAADNLHTTVLQTTRWASFHPILSRARRTENLRNAMQIRLNFLLFRVTPFYFFIFSKKVSSHGDLQ
jgi:hypothetical protein